MVNPVMVNPVMVNPVMVNPAMCMLVYALLDLSFHSCLSRRVLLFQHGCNRSYSRVLLTGHQPGQRTEEPDETGSEMAVSGKSPQISATWETEIGCREAFDGISSFLSGSDIGVCSVATTEW